MQKDKSSQGIVLDENPRSSRRTKSGLTQRMNPDRVTCRSG